jgi:hypothetical protein
MAAVCDQSGKQLSDFQGRHVETLAAFEKAGIDWRTLEFHGTPDPALYEKLFSCHHQEKP